MKICSIVVLYEPNNKEIENILDYYDSVDKAYILDNSVESRKIIVNDVLSKRNGCVKEKAEYIHFHKNIGLCCIFNNCFVYKLVNSIYVFANVKKFINGR